MVSPSLSTTRSSQQHIASLDGLRGLAILAVVITHFGGNGESSHRLLRRLEVLIPFGWSGVSLFFVLSGFLITGILWDSRATSGWLKKFFARRMLRIFPLYYLSLLIAVVMAVVMGNVRVVLAHLCVFFLYLQNYPRLFEWANHSPSPLVFTHFWSLAVEEQFYLLWPFVIAMVASRRAARNLCLAIFFFSFGCRLLCYTHLAHLQGLYARGSLSTRCGELALGGFVALCYRDPVDWERLVRWSKPLALGSLAAIVIVFWRSRILETRAHLSFGLAAITLLFAALLVRALSPGLTATLLRWRFLRMLGKYSYGLYVYHLLFYTLFLRIVAKIAPHAGPASGRVFLILVMLAITVPVTLLSFHFFERPFLAARSHFQSPLIQTALSAAQNGHSASEQDVPPSAHQAAFAGSASNRL